ncbi:MAG TPA: hypothetical protein VK733_05020 [Gemmatimonadaceae bacterium]|nr:hypothetical protein [Gemmatimonadaceae bacterium]
MSSLTLALAALDIFNARPLRILLLMNVDAWSLPRFTAFLLVASLALVCLAVGRYYISGRRAYYDAVREQYMPPGAFVFGQADSPVVKVLHDAFNAQIRLNVAARGVQLLAVLLLCVVAVVAWKWLSPTRLP